MAGPQEERAALFKKDNVTSLAAVLESLLLDANKRAALGQAGRRWVEEERNWRAVTQKYSEALMALQPDMDK